MRYYLQFFIIIAQNAAVVNKIVYFLTASNTQISLSLQNLTVNDTMEKHGQTIDNRSGLWYNLSKNMDNNSGIIIGICLSQKRMNIHG